MDYLVEDPPKKTKARRDWNGNLDLDIHVHVDMDIVTYKHTYRLVIDYYYI